MMVATSRRASRHVDADGRQRRADPGVTPALGTSPLGDGFQKRRLLSEAWATFCGEVGRTWYRGRAENRGFPSSSGEGGLIGPPRSARDGLDRAALFPACSAAASRVTAKLCYTYSARTCPNAQGSSRLHPLCGHDDSLASFAPRRVRGLYSRDPPGTDRKSVV